jgi:hypothetical protein
MEASESFFVSNDIADIIDLKSVSSSSHLKSNQLDKDIKNNITSAWFDDKGMIMIKIKGSIYEYLNSFLDKEVYGIEISNQKYKCEVIKLEKDDVYLRLEKEYAGI